MRMLRQWMIVILPVVMVISAFGALSGFFGGRVVVGAAFLTVLVAAVAGVAILPRIAARDR